MYTISFILLIIYRLREHTNTITKIAKKKKKSFCIVYIQTISTLRVKAKPAPYIS